MKGTDGRRLETKIGLEVLSDFTDKTLEGQLADQELGGLLVTTDLTKSDCTRSVSVWLLDTSGGGSGFASCLCGELLAWGFATGGFTCGLLYEVSKDVYML